ncbi:MAG: hypothetical protein ACM3S5_08785 [Rhodospirillales bacterium]
MGKPPIVYLQSVKHRLAPWLILLLLAGVCGGIIAGVAAYRARSASTAGLLRRLPEQNSVVVYIDFAALRQAGIMEMLTASRVAQEPEYRAFVEETAFDYTRDLDSAMVSFGSTGTYFFLRGRFDWKNLNNYTIKQGGTCNNGFCRVEGSTAQRKISYFPVRRDIMALAVSPDEWAASQLQTRRPEPEMEIPQDPVWSVIGPAVLKEKESLPAGTRMFASALEGAERVVLSLGPEGDAMRLRLDVTCRDAGTATGLATQLTAITAQLRSLILRENQQPNPNDLSGVLTSGTFATEGRRVTGHWPIQRGFLETLAGGGG